MNNEQIKWLAELAKVLESIPEGLNITSSSEIELVNHSKYTEIVVYTILRTAKK